jgi:hypothetical protein
MKDLRQVPVLIDVANSYESSDCLAVFHCLHRHFFLGNWSGLFFISTLFGRLVSIVNMTPLLTDSAIETAADTGLEGLPGIRRIETFLVFRGILALHVGDRRSTSEFDENELGILDYSAV